MLVHARPLRHLSPDPSWAPGGALRDPLEPKSTAQAAGGRMGWPRGRPRLPGADAHVVRRAARQARVEHLAAGRHGDIVDDHLVPRRRRGPLADHDVPEAQPRRRHLLRQAAHALTMHYKCRDSLPKRLSRPDAITCSGRPPALSQSTMNIAFLCLVA